MPKRTFWLATGVVIGAGSSLWAERKVRRSVQQATARLQPDAIVVEVGRSARHVAGTAGGRVRDAVTSGRDEMQRREEELWADLASHAVTHAVTHGVEYVPAALGPPIQATPPTPPTPPAPPKPAGTSAPVALTPHEERGARRRARRTRVKSPSHLDK